MFDWGSEMFPGRRPFSFLPRGGGGRRRARPKPDGHTGSETGAQGIGADLQEEPLPETREEKSSEPKAVLKKAGWVEATTRFQTDAAVFAEFEVPESEQHRTQVDFQLVRLQDGKYLPHGSAHGRLDASGRATARMPVHKDRADKETFRILVRHGAGEWSDGKGTDREVTESAEADFQHDHVSGLHFPKHSSFVAPGYLKVFKEMEKAFTEWRAKHPNGKVVIYGHAEQDEQNPHPHPLSVRRAQIAFAFLTGDVHTWGRIAREEKWGVWEQHMLHAMGFYPESPDGIPGPETDKAIQDFITWLNEAECKDINPMLGFTEEYIRLELYRVYITGPRRAVNLPSSRFRTVAGYPYVGCGAFNRYKGEDGHQGENRRATFLFVSENANFPALFPCKSGPGPCEAEAAKAGERAVKGFRCKFYDGLMKEEKPANSDLIGSLEKSDGKFDRLSFEEYQGQGYVLKYFRKYEGGAIQLRPERRVLEHPTPIPSGFKNECASLVQFYGIPHTSRWKRGPRDCDLEPGALPQGTVVATLRDGKYYSDYSGRSHVGIYLSHDDYQEYLSTNDSKAGIRIFDQFNGSPIKERTYHYAKDGNAKGNPARQSWVDSDGNIQRNRVN